MGVGRAQVLQVCKYLIPQLAYKASQLLKVYMVGLIKDKTQWEQLLYLKNAIKNTNMKNIKKLKSRSIRSGR